MATYGKTTSAQGGTMGGTLGSMYSGYGKPADRSLKGMGSKEVAKGMAAKATSATQQRASIKGDYPSTGKQGRVRASTAATQSAREPDSRRFGR
jgi:hypothetical protein